MFGRFVACVLLTASAQTMIGAEQTVLSSRVPAPHRKIQIQAFPPGALVDSAILYVDVPDGASVEINKEPIPNWTWSRYRHYWITGLDLNTRKSICVTVTVVRDWPACKQTVYQCTKRVDIMAGDRQNLRFHARDLLPFHGPAGPCKGLSENVNDSVSPDSPDALNPVAGPQGRNPPHAVEQLLPPPKRHPDTGSP